MFGFSLNELVHFLGYAGIFGLVFAESGLFIGFFLPGDSLLFTAGLVASQGYFSLPLLILLSIIAAILGDSVGYAFGRRVGKSLFNRPESRFFRPEYLVRAKIFYERHGAKTIVLARFVPFVRTFAPILAGIGKMQYSTFLTYNVIGGLLWSISLPILGYFLGNLIPNVDQYILPIIGIIVIVSLLPPIIEYLQQRSKGTK
jgi:membrane-associated protein